MIGAIVLGTFFAILFIVILIMVFMVKSVNVKCLSDAYKMYLLENGYKQPEKEVIENYYKQAVKRTIK